MRGFELRSKARAFILRNPAGCLDIDLLAPTYAFFFRDPAGGLDGDLLAPTYAFFFRDPTDRLDRVFQGESEELSLWVVTILRKRAMDLTLDFHAILHHLLISNREIDGHARPSDLSCPLRRIACRLPDFDKVGHC